MPHDSEVALLFYLLENKRENEGVKMKLEY